jgi:glycosyltransferase involved in cell wall biosynthesis
MRIAEVCPRFLPFVGGVESTVANLSQRLVGAGNEVEVLTTDPLGTLPDIERKGDIVVRRFRSWAPGEAYYFSLGLAGYLRRHAESYDIVHAHSYLALPALHAAMSKNMNRLVFNPYYHARSKSTISNILRGPYRQFWKHFINRVDKVIFVSRAEESLFCSDLEITNDRVIVIPSGVDVGRIARAEPYPESAKIILYVGRLEKYKNVDLIIRLMPYLSDVFVLRIAGNGPYLPNLAGLIMKLGLQKRVQIHSNLGNEEIARWYATCSVYVTLSRTESFGITLLEARAADKPVVASDIPSHREVADEIHGISLVDVSSPDVRSIAAEIDQASRSSPGTSNLERFSWDSVTRRTMDVYRNDLL